MIFGVGAAGGCMRLLVEFSCSHITKFRKEFVYVREHDPGAPTDALLYLVEESVRGSRIRVQHRWRSGRSVGEHSIIDGEVSGPLESTASMERCPVRWRAQHHRWRSVRSVGEHSIDGEVCGPLESTASSMVLKCPVRIRWRAQEHRWRGVMRWVASLTLSITALWRE